MNFDPKDLSPELKQAFINAKASPLKFAETFLIDPNLKKPFKATYPQKFILGSQKRDIWVCVHRRAGKMSPLSSLVYTDHGYTTMGEIKLGDLVTTPSGETAEVTDIIDHGSKEIYRLYLDDGTAVEAGDEHEWEVYTKTCWKGGRGKSRQQYGNVIKTTQEILDNLTYTYSNRIEFNYKLNGVKPVYHTEKDLLIDPYLLGVLLGDGHMKTRQITSADPDILTTIQERSGCSFHSYKSPNSTATNYTVKLDNLKEYLNILNLSNTKSHTKYIPTDYLYGSIEQRLWLLRGLMDTDGSSDKRRKGQAEYCTVSEQLSQDVANLARSLGCKVKVKKTEAAYSKNGIRKVTGFRYRLAITIPEGLEIFNLERKKCGGLPERYLRRTIIKVEKTNTFTEMRCISIDHPSHLYLTNNYTPTHNCVVGDTLVIDGETLEPIPISEASHIKFTLVFDFRENKVVKAPCTWFSSGKKQCIKLEFEGYNHESLSTDHQVFCSKRGWIIADQLKIGDKILAPSSIEVYGDADPDEDSLYLDLQFSLSDKKVSRSVYQYNREKLILFIRELFLEKGRLFQKYNSIFFMLWSKDLASEIRHLLLRIGVYSTVDDDGNLSIEDSMDKSFFLQTIGIEHTVTEVRSPRRWETITSIKKLGMRDVYDLSVDHPDHNFIGNNVVLHNSYALSIAAIWHAITKPGQKVVVFAPSSTQINEFFDAIDKWIVHNPFLQALQNPVGNHKNPQKRSFDNGSTIQGYLMGLAGSIEGAKRGITADVVFVDEGQLLDKEDWDVIVPIMVGDHTRLGKVKCYIAGTTPDDPDKYYYEKLYKLPASEFEELVFIPITENPEYNDEEREAIKSKVPLSTWNTEYLLELTQADTAVFRQEDILACSEYDWTYGPDNIKPNLVRFIGVDWDKAQAGTNIAVLQYNPESKITQMIYREEVPRDKFTFLNACKTILELYEVYQPELVIADQGQGEAQWEFLQMESERRGSSLADRLIKKALNEKIEVPSLQQELETEKKLIKPFLVGMLQRKIQEKQLLFPNSDEGFRNQLLAYKVVKTTLNTTKYTTHNEHIIDCCLFCMYGIWYLFENEFEKGYGGSARDFVVFDDTKLPVTDFHHDQLWASLDGPRVEYQGVQIPRSGIHDFLGKPVSDQVRDFYLD